ncbi:MAG: FN3 domain-containing metallophosphoesterase family protein [Niabella sp.]
MKPLFIKKHLVLRVMVFFVFFAMLSISANAQDNIKISHGPYLQAMTDTSVTIVWTTNKPAVGWVELAPDDASHFYQKERPKFFDASNGLKNISSVHKVMLKSLQPNTRYRYRVYSQEVLKHEFVYVNYGNVAATDVYSKKPLSFITAGRPGPFEFAMVNDIHERNNVLIKLLSQVDFKTTDFIVFNGDMINNSSSEAQLFSGFMDTATLLFAKETPMYYARGNHETRAPFASKFPDYFPTTSGHLYYMFTRGEACFIVLDGGEDKPDTDIEYSGITDMDNYRTEQSKWLREAVQTNTFKKAKFKIAICHIPPGGSWHGGRDIFEKWVPILNDAGIQVMLSGHEHRHRIQQPNADVKFPVIVNSNNDILKAKISDREARFSMFNLDGKKVDELILH